MHVPVLFGPFRQLNMKRMSFIESLLLPLIQWNQEKSQYVVFFDTAVATITY
jgi:hypothetical protein